MKSIDRSPDCEWQECVHSVEMGKQGRLKNREIREKKIRAEKIKKKKEWTAKTSANLSQICSWKFTKDGALGWKGGMDVKKAEK